MKEKKIIAFDLYDTCFEFTVPSRSYTQLLSTAGLYTYRKEIRNAFMTSGKNIEDIISEIAPNAKMYKHIEKFHEKINNELLSVQLFPETISVLSLLREKGYKRAAISNLGKPYIQPLERLLPHTFDYEVLSCNVGAKKPNKEIFDCLKNITGYAADEIVMVGDSMYSDVEGAKSSGIQAVHIDRSSRGINYYKDYISISTLEELLDIL